MTDSGPLDPAFADYIGECIEAKLISKTDAVSYAAAWLHALAVKAFAEHGQRRIADVDAETFTGFCELASPFLLVLRKDGNAQLMPAYRRGDSAAVLRRKKRNQAAVRMAKMRAKAARQRAEQRHQTPKEINHTLSAIQGVTLVTHVTPRSYAPLRTENMMHTNEIEQKGGPRIRGLQRNETEQTPSLPLFLPLPLASPSPSISPPLTLNLRACEETAPQGCNPEAWAEWIAYRRRIGKRVKDFESAAATMRALGDFEAQRRAVAFSRGNGYQGLFADRGSAIPRTALSADAARVQAAPTLGELLDDE